MPDTRRSLAALQSLFATNGANAIDAQDGRDGIISSHPEKVIQTGLFASFPSSPLAGDLYFPTDGGRGTYRYDGSGWIMVAPASGMHLIAELSAASSASLAFTARNKSGLTGNLFQSDFDSYFFELIDILPATNGAQLLMQVSIDAGATYDTSGNYATVYTRWSKTGGSQGGAASDTGIDIGGGLSISNDATEQGLSAEIRFKNPRGTSGWKKLTFHSTWWYNGTPELLGAIGGAAYKSATAVDTVRFIETSGAIASGVARVYGVAK